VFVDSITRDYFSSIKQVFLYIGDKCNLFCEHCLYKPNVLFEKSISPKLSKDLLRVFRNLGAFKLTLLGGEVSLYDIEHDNKDLIDVLKFSKEAGYSYIRIDTNGQSSKSFFRKEITSYIDEVSFSLDGYDDCTNDVLRGDGAFSKALQNIKLAISAGINVQITTCITKQNTSFSNGIISFIDKMISFCETLGVQHLNFHGVFKMGVPMDLWTGDSHLNPLEWLNAANVIHQNIINDKYSINVRFPLHLITQDEFDKKPDYYGYCPCKKGERALIHPDRIIRVCSSMLSTPYGVANFDSTSILWNHFNNELSDHDFTLHTPCTNQKLLYRDEIVPICFSIKPYQDEPVWNKQLMDSGDK
jgi:MoaA/NifB/PqqE/SkfB family radical SAM enzyme